MLRIKGFTLIELIIVCSIAALLASIAIPNYNNYIKNSHKLKAIAGADEVYIAFMWYYRDNASNLSGITAATQLRKVLSYNIYSVEIINSNELVVKISYEHENSVYNLDIYPKASKYYVKDEKYNLLYNYEG